MKENNQEKGRSLYPSEIVLYSIFGSIWLVGLVFAILGMFAYNYGKLSENNLYALEKSFAKFFHMQGAMDFRLWGTIVMVVMMICFLITVYAYADRAEKKKAAERRKAERMRILMEADATKNS